MGPVGSSRLAISAPSVVQVGFGPTRTVSSCCSHVSNCHRIIATRIILRNKEGTSAHPDHLAAVPMLTVNNKTENQSYHSIQKRRHQPNRALK